MLLLSVENMRHTGSATRERSFRRNEIGVPNKMNTDMDSGDEEEQKPSGPSSMVNIHDLRYYVRIFQYILLCILIILLFSYSFEHQLRISLVEQFTQQLEVTSEAIFAEKQKLQLEEEEQEASLSGQVPCSISGSSSTSQLLSSATTLLDSGKVNVQDAMDSWRSRHQDLVDGLVRMSKELLRVKYGAPPYFVRLDLTFPSNQEGGFVLLEVDGAVMPYTSLYFLEQVSLGAWDTCQFILNAGVLLQVDTRGDRCHRAAFKSIPSVGEFLAFQEYNPKLTRTEAHKRLTVGFTGRPGGPIFYISLINNQASLGPRKGDEDMGIFSMPPQADPCFAKVVRGEDLVELMNKQPVREGDTQIRLMQEFVTISKASVTASEEALKLIGDCNPTTTVC